MNELAEIMRQIEGTFNDYITGADDDIPDDNSFLNAVYKTIKPHVKTETDKMKIELAELCLDGEIAFIHIRREQPIKNRISELIHKIEEQGKNEGKG